MNGEFCNDGYCELLTCPPEGECPAGFHDVEGSYYCYYVGDPESDGGAGASDGGADAGSAD
ncbi:MAG: hypothetical protein HY897_06150 [Deltaproteobacteria bacterium]|nr:hypothetical protein [Deltaproteobacteria bacterium]